MPDELSELLEDLDKAQRLTGGPKRSEGSDGHDYHELAEALPIKAEEEREDDVPEAEPIEHIPSTPIKDPVITGLMDDLKAIIASMGECRSLLNGSAKS
jgi:hypothetical protein